MLAKGVKRKWSEEEGAEPLTAPASSSLFSLSVSKLHQSLQHVEPNLRHLVLVANTLRRIQEEMQPAAVTATSNPQPGLGREALLADSNSPPGLCAVDALQDTGRRLGLPPPAAAAAVPPPPPPLVPVDELLLSTMDISVFSSILEDVSGVESFRESLHPSTSQPDEAQFCLLSPEPERTSHLEILGPGSLLEDGLEGLFEDIDTSMYDSDLWSASSLPSFKEAFSRAEGEGEGGLGLEDLDYLMDMIVGTQKV